jgi:hypothetical protein
MVRITSTVLLLPHSEARSHKLDSRSIYACPFSIGRNASYGRGLVVPLSFATTRANEFRLFEFKGEFLDDLSRWSFPATKQMRAVARYIPAFLGDSPYTPVVEWTFAIAEYMHHVCDAFVTLSQTAGSACRN